MKRKAAMDPHKVWVIGIVVVVALALLVMMFYGRGLGAGQAARVDVVGGTAGVIDVAGDVDSEVSVPIVINSAEELGVVGIVLDYDPTMLQYVSVTPGSGLDFIPQNVPVTDGRELRFGLYGVSDLIFNVVDGSLVSVDVAVVTFRILNSGEHQVSWDTSSVLPGETLSGIITGTSRAGRGESCVEAECFDNLLCVGGLAGTAICSAGGEGDICNPGTCVEGSGCAIYEESVGVCIELEECGEALCNLNEACVDNNCLVDLCGNGVVDAGGLPEQCDDGNEENYDSCTNACQIPFNHMDLIEWIDSSDGILVWDRDGNGQVSRDEFFSNTKVTSRDVTNGFEDLALLDSNGDGTVSSLDLGQGDLPNFNQLFVWRDVADFGVVNNELIPLSALGITQLRLSYRQVSGGAIGAYQISGVKHFLADVPLQDGLVNLLVLDLSGEIFTSTQTWDTSITTLRCSEGLALGCVSKLCGNGLVGGEEECDGGVGCTNQCTAAEGYICTAGICSEIVDMDFDGATSDVDCDDFDVDRSPYFTEICGNGIDEDCDASNDLCALGQDCAGGRLCVGELSCVEGVCIVADEDSDGVVDALDVCAGTGAGVTVISSGVAAGCILGDVDLSGVITPLDAVEVLKYVVATSPGDVLDKAQRVLANTNCDGTINPQDAVKILTKVVGTSEIAC
jgi:cysteine-rich repeat protein